LAEFNVMPETPSASVPLQGPGAFRLSEELAKLEKKSRGQSINLGDVIFLLDERAHTFLLLLLSLPFVQPIPLPGLSTPFGVAIALLGIGFLLGKKPWLPQRLLKTQLPRYFWRLRSKACVAWPKSWKFCYDRECSFWQPTPRCNDWKVFVF